MNALRTNRKAAVAAIIAGDLLVLMLGWFLLIGPQRATARAIAQSTAATEAQVSEASRPIAQVDPSAVQQQQPDIRTADLYSLAKAMPSDTDTPDLLLELSLLARESGVTLSTIAPSTLQPPPGGVTAYSLLPVTLAVSGDFYTLTDFIYRLRTLVGVRDGRLLTAGRLYSIGQISLTGGAGVSKDLTANISLDAYVWGSAPGTVPAVAVPPAAPTDTSGSTTTAPSN